MQTNTSAGFDVYERALAMLGAAVEEKSLPWAQKLRAAELIAVLSGLQVPPSGHRVRRSARELIEESRFDRRIRTKLREESREDAIKEARAFLEKHGSEVQGTEAGE